MAKEIEVVKVIRTTLERRGRGTPEDPHRKVEQYYTFDGELLFEKDPCASVPPVAEPSVESTRCQCDGHNHDGVGCWRTAWTTVTRAGRRLRVCDRCDMTTDTDSVPLGDVNG